jgi:hypothetical protein
MNPFHMNQQHDRDFVTTILTNPGIIDRLEQDIADYLSSFGFSLKRHRGGETGCKNNINVRCNAMLVVPRCPNSFYEPSTVAIFRNKGCAADGSNAANSAAMLPLLSEADPLRTLHLIIHDASLLVTVGPLLRTFLRLSPPHMHPMRLRAVIHCKFTLDALEKIDKMSLEQRLDHLNRQEEMNARRLTHHLHMLVRNSMGSALCVKLVVVMPCYWRRKFTCEEEAVMVNGGSSQYNQTKIPISENAVLMAMRDNPDACYPTIQLVEQCNTNGMIEDPSSNKNDERSPAALHLHVRTRMCTVRCQPLLFRWISSWQGATIHHTWKLTMHSKPHRLERFPLVVACIEKVGNLHRILMLLHDHDEKNRRNTNRTSERSLSTKLVIILPTTAIKKKNETRRNFDDAIDNFYNVVLGEEQGSQHEYEKKSMQPTLVHEDDAADMISELAIRCQLSSSPQSQPQFVGIDLHPDALTLYGDYATATPISPALQTIRQADAILFGYESTGIPNTISEQLLLNSWVQIPSRSSINVVAAMSIVLDALA